MPFIRSVRPTDLPSLVELAGQTTFGLTTLSADPERLRERIDASESGESPLLVMVVGTEPRVIGTAGLVTHVGDSRRAEPFYAYRLERSVHRSESLHVHHEIDALHLVKLFDGPTELGTLFLHPDFRGGGLGRVLSLSRFLLIARDPDHYDRQVIAELRGVIDEQGRSPFWEGLGRHFFKVDFPIADILSSRDKRFIAELMPTHPIYVPLLPPAAQDVIGKVHPKTEPARRLLESEGFEFAKMVDIFDGGPCLRCDRKAIRTITASTVCELTEVFDGEPGRVIDSLVATADAEFRAIGCLARHFSDGIALHRDDARRLQVEVGDRLVASPLRDSTAAESESRSSRSKKRA